MGTAGGTALGVGLSWVSNRWQWNRSQSVRWHDDRRRAYGEFLAAGDAYEEAVCALASSNPPDPWRVDSAELTTAYEALKAAMTQLTMFAGVKVGKWASMYIRLLVPAFGELNDGHSFGPYGWAAVDLDRIGTSDDDFLEAKSQFVVEARREIGLQVEAH